MTNRRTNQVIVGHGTTVAARKLGVTGQCVRDRAKRGEIRALRTSTGRIIVTDEEIDRLNKMAARRYREAV